MTNSRSDTMRDLPSHTELDRARIAAEAPGRILADFCDGDRTDPAWVRYCTRHGLDPEAAT